MATTKKNGSNPRSMEELLKLDPNELTDSEKERVLAHIDKQVETMTADDVVKAVERGDLEVEYVDPPNPIDNFTEENFKKFLFGKITWAQLEGMTMEQAYAIAEFGYTMYQQGRYKDARTLFEGLVIGNPYDPYFHAMLGAISYVNRGELLLQHGEFEYAMEDLKAAIELDPEGKNPASLRARALAAATAAVIKELIERKEKGDDGAPKRSPQKPAARPPQPKK